MAHANPEYALALRAWKEPPESHKKAPPASLAQMRARMYAIGRALKCGSTVSAADEQAYRIWQRVVRQQRDDDAVRGDAPAPASSQRSARCPVIEPTRKFPANVQAGRVKVRRGTLAI